MPFTGKRKSWLLAGIACIGAIGIVLSYTPGSSDVRRPPTEHETVLYYFAQNLGETALCDRISWVAYQRYSILFGGGGASFWRSDCYEQAAQARHDASICWQARPLVDLDPFSTGHSALSCARRTRSGSRSAFGLADGSAGFTSSINRLRRRVCKSCAGTHLLYSRQCAGMRGAGHRRHDNRRLKAGATHTRRSAYRRSTTVLQFIF